MFCSKKEDNCEYRTTNPVKNNPNKPNGCGAEGGIKFPSLFSGGQFLLKPVYVSFEDACNQHDICYGTCNSEKQTCDKNFEDNLIEACFTGAADIKHINQCTRYATAYAIAVKTMGGNAYNDAQDSACEWEKCCCMNSYDFDSLQPIQFDGLSMIPFL